MYERDAFKGGTFPPYQATPRRRVHLRGRRFLEPDDAPTGLRQNGFLSYGVQTWQENSRSRDRAQSVPPSLPGRIHRPASPIWIAVLNAAPLSVQNSAGTLLAIDGNGRGMLGLAG